MQSGRQRTARFLSLFYATQDANSALFDLIKTELRRSVSESAHGPIVATSGNGRSTTLSIPNEDRFETSGDRQNTFVILHDLYQQACQRLGFKFPPDQGNSANDAAIFQQMTQSNYFDTVRSSYGDWTGLNINPLNNPRLAGVVW